MHLSSITLKGFKSFPDRTRLTFSPGVSVIVGPNGSGKSNITDAVLWALGEQSPGAIRGASMQDVISAGGKNTAQRREAQVEVVIDNTCDDWDYADAARYLLDRFEQLRPQHAKLCLLSVGEVTVRLGQQHGAGGRNQQFALACAVELAEPGYAGSMAVLSAGSDGTRSRPTSTS